MIKAFTERKRFRKNLGSIKENVEIPNLIEIQKDSYNAFLQLDVNPLKREKIGLQEIFEDVFPASDPAGKVRIDFLKYELEPTGFSVEECRSRGLTYSNHLKATFRLTVLKSSDSGKKEIEAQREQDVYVCELPMLTQYGTFVVNGIERVIVSQMQRSPGVFFDHDGGKTHTSGKYLFAGHVIPSFGAWLDFEFDSKDHICVRVDRRRKMPIAVLLMAMYSDETEKLLENSDKKGSLDKSKITGMTREEIISHFYDSYVIRFNQKNGTFWRDFKVNEWMPGIAEFDVVDADTGNVVFNAGDKITNRGLKKAAESGVKKIIVRPEHVYNKYCACDIVDLDTGIVLFEAGTKISEENFADMALGVTPLSVALTNEVGVGTYIIESLNSERISSREEALYEIYKVLRPGDPPSYEGAEFLFSGLFFDRERYDLSSVGRSKLNERLGNTGNSDERTLTKKDILAILKELINLKDGRSSVDDIDNLGNRRIRAVGELLQNQVKVGLSRIDKMISDRLSLIDVNKAMPNDLINANGVSIAIKDFFMSSQLSQFMDQCNPLSEITHKRRISALGPGGLNRDRAGFEVRDVHPTHYGRLCPVETPEGPNIGLISSLAIFAKVNDFGFIESPYKKVVNGKVTNTIQYLSATDEGKYTIAQANAKLNEDNELVEEFVSARRNGDTLSAQKESIDYMDVSPKQLVSVAAGLIPFLENDDATRALMGSNMQRQAVPLMRSRAPLVGTGIESKVAIDSGAVVIAKRGGVVDQVDANRIVVRAVEGKTIVGVDIYNLRKFERSNQSTCINQKPIVKVGDKIKAGDVIADGAATDLGELALGQNVKIGFMLWNGYNYEDAIIISERMVSEDMFTSIHIEEFEVVARDTKLGDEEITRDLPNISEDAVRNLDETGIINIGAQVKAGDILVGKVTPKGETVMTPEEKLLRAIFGERSSDVRDSSLRLPPGCSGTVVDVKIFSRKGVAKDERAKLLEKKEIDSLKADLDAKKEIIENNFVARLRAVLVGNEYSVIPNMDDNKTLSAEVFDSLSRFQLLHITMKDDELAKKYVALKKEYTDIIADLEKRFEEDVIKVKSGSELAPGVLKIVKVYVAEKRKLQVGDKLAGRHGNKGIVSKVVPIADMPYFEDGTPLDIMLNPLGVPSRMNIGQVLETHLGWASIGYGKQVREILEKVSKEKLVSELRTKLSEVYGDKEVCKDLDKMTDYSVVEMATNLTDGVPMATPVFDGAKEADIVRMLNDVGFDASGQVTLYDGRTGEPFDRKITVGCMYILKLHHMVDDKLHARSIGPYSLVTQQPLGGKAQFGGQRFGEMEVWALQAHGAAHILQEVLTVKSDDVNGRTKAYESIIRGDNNIVPGIPESFNVLSKEICGLGLNFEFQKMQVDSDYDDTSDLWDENNLG